MSKVPKSIRSRWMPVTHLYHLSFNGVLEGMWTPGTQAGSDVPGEAENSSWAYPELSMAAVCTSPTIEECFTAIYPNVSKFFEVDKVPHMNLYVYKPIFDGSERVVLPQELTQGKWVWDAHVTHEHRILDMVKMKLVGEIEVMNTNSSSDRTTHPFNDVHNPKEYVGPLSIKYKWL